VLDGSYRDRDHISNYNDGWSSDENFDSGFPSNHYINHPEMQSIVLDHQQPVASPTARDSDCRSQRSDNSVAASPNDQSRRMSIFDSRRINKKEFYDYKIGNRPADDCMSEGEY
jgi:hypothetical protein